MAQPAPIVPHAGSALSPDTWLDRYGPLGIAVFAFAVVIVYLFKLMRGDQTTIATERIAWAAEREKLKLEYETRHRELSEKYAAALVAEIHQCRANELEIRREYATRIEDMAESQQSTNDRMIVVVEKLADKLTTVPTPRSKGGY